MKDFVDTLVAVAMVGVAIAAVVCEIFVLSTPVGKNQCL